MVKLLTRGHGRFLGNAERELTRALTKHAAWVMYQANRRQVLESLAVLSQEIARFSGRELGVEMASRLRAWADQNLLRPECKVVIVAQGEDGAPLVTESASPKQEPALSESGFIFLRTTLSSQEAESVSWSPYSKGTLVEALRALSPAGCAHTVSIPGVSRLKGYILFSDREAFSRDEEDAVREAARAMAVLLNAEAARDGFKQTVGRFRHATLGPIQGVQS